MSRKICPRCGTMIPCIECVSGICPNCTHDLDE